MKLQTRFVLWTFGLVGGVAVGGGALHIIAERAFLREELKAHHERLTQQASYRSHANRETFSQGSDTPGLGLSRPRPLRRRRGGGMRRISVGMLDPIPVPSRRDELGWMGEELNHTIGKLREADEMRKNFFAQVKYTAKGSVEIALKSTSNLIHCAVKDTGLGIPEEEQPRLFDRFFRSASTGKHIKGTGLGLYISKSLVELHGGKIWHEPNSPEGSIFHFTLPRGN